MPVTKAIGLLNLNHRGVLSPTDLPLVAERPESARLARCPAFPRRSLDRTDSGRSRLAAGTRPHAPLATLAALFAHLAGERQPNTGAQGATVEQELEISRGGSKGFCQVNVDRLGNISKNPNTADRSEWRAGEWVQGHS